MKIKLSLITTLLFFIIISISCDTKEKPKVVQYPNGGSELALLMRSATDQLEQQKMAVLNGESLQNYPLDVSHLLTAIPTEEGKNLTDGYQQKADQFLKHIQKRDSIPISGQIEYYNMTVSMCVNCHTTECPGPNMKIKKLYIKQ